MTIAPTRRFRVAIVRNDQPGSSGQSTLLAPPEKATMNGM
jgi:hypothetical protein